MAGTLCLIGCPAASSDPSGLVSFLLQNLLPKPQDITLICSSDPGPCSLAIQFSTALSAAHIQVDYAWDARHIDSVFPAEPDLPNMVLVSEPFGSEDEYAFRSRISKQMEIPVEGVRVVLTSVEVIEEIAEMCEMEKSKSALMFRKNRDSREIELFEHITQEQVREVEAKAMEKYPKSSFSLQPALPQASLNSLKAAILKTVTELLPPAQLSEEQISFLESRITEETQKAISTLNSQYNEALQHLADESQEVLEEMQRRHEQTNQETTEKLAQTADDYMHLLSTIMELDDLARNVPDNVKTVEVIRAKLETYEFTNREVLKYIESQPKPKLKSLPITINDLRINEDESENLYIVALRNAKRYTIEGVTLKIQTQVPDQKVDIATDLQLRPGESEVKVTLPDRFEGKLKLIAYQQGKIISNELDAEVQNSKPAAPSVGIAKPGPVPKPLFSNPQPISKPTPQVPKPAEADKKPEEKKAEEPKPAEARPLFSTAPKGFGKFSPKPFGLSKPGDISDKKTGFAETTPAPATSKPLPKPAAFLQAAAGEEKPKTEGTAQMKPVFKPANLKSAFPLPLFKPGTEFKPVFGSKPGWVNPVPPSKQPADSPTASSEEKTTSLVGNEAESQPKSVKEPEPVRKPLIEEIIAPGTDEPSTLPPSQPETLNKPLIEGKPDTQAKPEEPPRPKPVFPSAVKPAMVFPVFKPSVRPSAEPVPPPAETKLQPSKPPALNEPGKPIEEAKADISSKLPEADSEGQSVPNKSKPGPAFVPKPFFSPLPQKPAIFPKPSTQAKAGAEDPKTEQGDGKSNEPAKPIEEIQQISPIPLPPKPSTEASPASVATAAGAKPGPMPVPKFLPGKPGPVGKPGSAPLFPNPFKPSIPKPPAVISNDTPPNPPLSKTNPSAPANPLLELTPDQRAKIAEVKDVVGEGFSSDMERKLIELLKTPQGMSMTSDQLLDSAFNSV